MAKKFLDKHSWIDPTGKADEDSFLVRSLDQRMVAEGFDPGTEEYWDELESRLKKRMPERFKEAKAGERKSPPVNSGGDRPAGKKTTFVLSAARKQALVDGGYWDDPKRRMEMVRKYQKYDLENAQNKS